MENEKSSVSISGKSFLTAVIILGLLMIGTYILTFIIPAGEYEKIIVDGREVIVNGTYIVVDGGISFWKWLLSPLLVLTASDGGTVIEISIFLLVIGGVFYVLEQSGVLNYMLNKITSKYENKKYKLLCIIALVFMIMGSCIGSFEEVVPLVPITVALAYSMGWDALLGLGMSIFSAGCGFATAISNPFSIGVAQKLAGLPMFSGIGFRILSFVIIYVLLISFLIMYGKKIEKKPEKSLLFDENKVRMKADTKLKFEKSKSKDRALSAFCTIIGLGIVLIFLSPLIKPIQDLIMPIIALIFLIAGSVTAAISGMKYKVFMKNFYKGALGICPAVLLILMASSIKYTMTEAKVMDTLLFNATKIIENTPKGGAILFIYFLVLIIEIFIGSGSAKAFLLIPLIAPLVDLGGISRQTAMLAFAYGDGFSNMLYPTNPVLLISLGLAGVSYSKWFKWTVKFQGCILLITSMLLLLALKIGY